MLPQAENHRLARFRARSPFPWSTRRQRLFSDPLFIRKNLGCILLLTLSSAALVCVLMISWNLSTFFPSSRLPRTYKKPRIRRWIPPVPSESSQSLSLSSLPFLPHGHIQDEDNSKFLSHQVYSHESNGNGITAILPATAETIPNLKANLLSLVSSRPSTIHEIIIACHPSTIVKTERAVRNARFSLATSYPMTVLPWGLTDNPSLGVLHILPSVLTTQALILDDTAFQDIDDKIRIVLLEAAPSNVPVGPRGVVISPGNISCVYSLGNITPAAYLIPPFLSPTSLLVHSENGMRLDAPVWAALGNRIVSISGIGFGGLVISTGSLEPESWCMDVTHAQPDSTSTFLKGFYQTLERVANHVTSSPARISILLPVRENLEAFGPTACEMAQRGYILRILLFSWSQHTYSGHFVLDVGCHLHFATISSHVDKTALTKATNAWLRAGYDTEPDVLIYATQTSTQAMAIEASVDVLRSAEVTVVRLPVSDLPFCEWMSLLSVAEWKNWHKPRIDLSVITNDRPHSLARLLASLSVARYYGDSVHVKINLEQTADAETRRIVTDFGWSSGLVHVQHRVIRAGLLPAVVEAWYPRSNDSYGVLLEDDVELSPMFYAWIKLSVLRYRYGPPKTRAPSLFGISLYQPTNLELRVNGRVPFEPRVLFAEHNLPDPRTPYLSQIPCSWGAVYFPEHFREFHDYLALRLSRKTHDISEIIIPDIRSNRWTRSWKKYFNELVYLRGYVMLYPNFDFSLATNHAEVGAHVKSNSKIQRQFDVPLMPLPSTSADRTRGVSLLDLPDNSLPAWGDLPVLDLWGTLTSHEDISQRGRSRHELLSGCSSLLDPALFSYDANELLCVRSSSRV